MQKDKRFRILSRILRIDESIQPLSVSQTAQSSSPDIELIKTLKEKIEIDNPLLRLSMKDYEKMCENKMLFNMMVNVLNTTTKKLKKICKYINILKENINSSPESIKNKMKIQKTKIIDLPDTILNKVVEIYINTLEYNLRDWIPIDKLHWDKLSLNPNAIKLLEDKIEEEKILIKNRKLHLLQNNKRINWENLSLNINAIKLLRNNYVKIDWENLSKNINAIDILKEKWEQEKSLMIENKYKYLHDSKKINWNYLSANINAIDLLREKIELEKNKYYPFAGNEKINWTLLSENSGAIELLKENIDKIDWNFLSENSGAIELLEENKDKINWENFSSNTSTNQKAYELLMERIEYEKKLSSHDRYKLKNSISWPKLMSENPAIIKILEKNVDEYIHWNYLSKNPYAINLIKNNLENIKYYWIQLSLNTNPEAIDLLHERWKEEKHLMEYDIKDIKDKVYWPFLSRNINAMNLLRDKYYEEKEDEEKKDKKCIKNCIDWGDLSMNPSIFILK
jgi:hypothetical protein